MEDLRRGLPLSGWDRYSVWGYDSAENSFFAQLWRNADDRDSEPRIWITPGARYLVPVLSVLELAGLISNATDTDPVEVGRALGIFGS